MNLRCFFFSLCFLIFSQTGAAVVNCWNLEKSPRTAFSESTPIEEILIPESDHRRLYTKALESIVAPELFPTKVTHELTSIYKTVHDFFGSEVVDLPFLPPFFFAMECSYYAFDKVVSERFGFHIQPKMWGLTPKRFLERFARKIISTPLPKDFVVYRGADNSIQHVGVYVGILNGKMWVESKIGYTPVVVRHEIHNVPTFYGMRAEFHRPIDHISLSDFAETAR